LQIVRAVAKRPDFLRERLFVIRETFFISQVGAFCNRPDLRKGKKLKSFQFPVIAKDPDLRKEIFSLSL